MIHSPVLPIQTLTFDLRISTADFGKALRRLDRALPRRRREEVVLSHDGEMLHIELGGGTITVSTGNATARRIVVHHYNTLCKPTLDVADSAA